jgi:hypothetical protein
MAGNITIQPKQGKQAVPMSYYNLSVVEIQVKMQAMVARTLLALATLGIQIV